MQPRQADILIKNGIVLTLDPDNNRFEDGGVAICKDKIAAAGSSEQMTDWQADRVIDAGGGIIMPGLVNTHTHAAMTCFRGLADDLPLMSWLNEHIFPAEAKLNPEIVYEGTLLACAEMMLSGTTCFCDMYLFEGEVARAASDAAMRAVVGEVLYDFPSPNYGPIEKGFEYTEKLIARWMDNPLITIAVEPHSPYLCAPELLQTAFNLSVNNGIPLVIHLSETRSEVDQIMDKYGHTPVGFMAANDLLGPNVLACHCVVLTDKDIELLRQHRVNVSHCPESNMKLASGIAPVPRLLEQGVIVGLGTDGCASNNNLDMFAEMDTAAKLHKVASGDPTALDATSGLRMSTIEGARALGLDALIGSIEIGKQADIIVIDTHKSHLTPMYHPTSHLVYAARGSDVETVIINGRPVVENRQLVHLDLSQIMSDVRQIAENFREYA